MSRSDLAIAALLLATAVGYFSLSLRRSLDLRDEGLILHHSARVAAGDVPYEDFPDTYGPATLLTTGLVLRAFDGQIVPVRWLLAGLKALAVVSTFLICRPLVGRGFAVFGALASMAVWGRPSWNLNTPYAALYSVPLCLLGCLALIRALRVDSKAAYFVAGLIGGAVALFKQTLGAANALGMLLAVSAVTALAGAPAERSIAGGAQFLTLWVLGALVLILPATGMLQPTDYVLHFLPLHVAMIAVAASVVVRGGCARLTPAVGRRLAPLVAGLALPVGLEVMFFASRGELRALIFNAVTLPATIVNYYQPYSLPPLGRCLVLLAVIGAVFAVLLALRGQWSRAGVAASCAAGFLLGASVAIPKDRVSTAVLGPLERSIVDADWYWVLRALPGVIEGLEPALVLLGATAMLAPRLLAADRDVRAPVLRVVVPLMLLQAPLIYQVFPRGTYNLWIIQGALVPLATVVLAAWYRLGVVSTASRARRVTAAAVVAVLPVWLCAPAVGQVIETLMQRRVRELVIPRARGIMLTKADAKAVDAFVMEEMMRFLGASRPVDAPLLPITADLTLLYLSGRPHPFPDVDYYLYLLGMDMLPEAQRRELHAAPLGCRLAEKPDTLVVLRPDDAATRILRSVPGVRDTVTQDYETVATFGEYVVLRRKAGAQYPSSCAIRSR